MLDIMVDLETLGQRPGCSILSIGAMAFDKSQLGKECYIVVNRGSCTDNGLQEDEDTIKWWMKQDPAARQVITQAEDAEISKHLHHALDEFGEFVRSFGPGKVRVWGNGSDFDNAILAVAYDKCGRKLPWQFWNNRCYRTIKGMDGSKPSSRVGTYHNALDDAKTQAVHLQEILNRWGRALG